MKIAILSDIHSNVYALEAVMEDIESRDVGLLINLGDIFYGPIAPRATYELLERYDFVTIGGNQDREIYEATQEQMEKNKTLNFVIEDLGIEPIEWIKSLPFDDYFVDGIYLCHGTPVSDLIYLLEDVQFGYPRVRSEQEIIGLLDGNSSRLICCGHSHIPRDVTLSSGQMIVNPGSVGLQAYTDDEPVRHSMENFTSDASYAIAESADSGWLIEHIRVPYDVGRAVVDCRNRGRYDWAHYISTGKNI